MNTPIFYLACFIAAFATVLVACGDDGDDDIIRLDDSSWFTSISPSGVKVECIGINGRFEQSIWCMEVLK